MARSSPAAVSRSSISVSTESASARTRTSVCLHLRTSLVSDYTTPDAIAQALNTTFTPAQEAEALLAAHAVTEWIDDRTGRTWQGPSTITAEYHDACSVKLWMRTTPVATIDLVEYFSSDGWIVVDPSAYVLVDPRSGLVAYYGAGPVR